MREKLPNNIFGSVVCCLKVTSVIFIAFILFSETPGYSEFYDIYAKKSLAPPSLFQETKDSPEQKTVPAPLGKIAQRIRQEKPSISYPLNKIPKEDIKHIIVFGLIDKTPESAKLGEDIINLWSLVSGLHKKYPQAIIYVGSHFPEIYRARQFRGKIQPIPRSPEDIENWSYFKNEWKDYFLSNITSLSSSEHFLNFIKDKKIDLVVDTTKKSRFLLFGHPEQQENFRMPHVLVVESAIRFSSALGPDLWRIPEDTLYWDREGKSYTVTGKQEIIETLTPSGNFPPGGIWLFAMELYKRLGLDIDKSTLPKIELTIEESVGALAMVREFIHSSAPDRSFDPTRKIIVINVYAVTQRHLLSRETWAHLIATLIKNTDNAYFLFTHGGEMDRDTFYVDDIVKLVQKELPEAKDNIIMPRMNVYPHINNILGITSGLVTLDTGMSHLASGVYNIPTAIFTTPNIMHWLTPRDNVKPIILVSEYDLLMSYAGYDTDVIKKRAFELAEKELISFAHLIETMPERAESQAAKAAVASPYERHRLDFELFNKSVEMHQTEKHLRDTLEHYIDILDMKKYLAAMNISLEQLIPPVRFVNSATQTGVDIPRFSAKLFTTHEGKTFLFVDLSTLSVAPTEDGDTVATINPDVINFDIVHEILGHMLARLMYTELQQSHEWRPDIDENTILELRAEKELLARFTLYLCLYRLEKLGEIRLKENLRKRLTRMRAINDIDSFVNITTRFVGILIKNECLSTFRYTGLLHNKELTNKIKSKLKRTYLPHILELFGLTHMFKDYVPPTLELFPQRPTSPVSTSA